MVKMPHGTPAARQASNTRLAGLFVALVDVGKAAERDRQIAGADQHEIDALGVRDGRRVVHAALRLDHHADDGAVVRGRVVAREVARRAAARRRPSASPCGGKRAAGDRGGGLLIGFDQRNDDALGAGIERLADRNRAVIGGAHQHRHAIGHEPDRVFEESAGPTARAARR